MARLEDWDVVDWLSSFRLWFSYLFCTFFPLLKVSILVILVSTWYLYIWWCRFILNITWGIDLHVRSSEATQKCNTTFGTKRECIFAYLIKPYRSVQFTRTFDYPCACHRELSVVFVQLYTAAINFSIAWINCIVWNYFSGELSFAIWTIPCHNTKAWEFMNPFCCIPYIHRCFHVLKHN